MEIEYILKLEEFKGLDFDSLISEDILKLAEETTEKDFNEYIKESDQENLIKNAGIEYFIAIYLLIKYAQRDIHAGFKSKLKEMVIENNKIDKNIQNLDFYLGSCGIVAQDLVIIN
jgi:hypothetical protein